MSEVRWEREALDAQTVKHRVRDGERLLTRADVFERLTTDSSFALGLARQLAEAPFAAFFWELPGTSLDGLEAVYEHAVIDAPRLAGVTADERSFETHFTDEHVVAFDNLGGDAHLIAPCPEPGVEPQTYAHLANFVRSAPAAQVAALFAAAGTSVRPRLTVPRWLSTSGLGVHWLHIRLDTRPKYYVHGPYREVSSGGELR